MIALIDGDVIVYRVGFGSENQTEAQACMNTELVMEQILHDTQASSHRVFLSDKLENNFRYHIDNSYKANRRDAPKPKWYDSIRQFLINEFQAEFTPGQEADDALGIAQVTATANAPEFLVDEDTLSTIICSIDKDLLQIPGHHYNITSRKVTSVTYEQGIKSFYTQLLTGDRVDNIEGIRGVGPVSAKRILGEASDESELFNRVRDAYESRGIPSERLLINGQLLWVRRREGEIWQPPTSVSTGVERDSGYEESPRDSEPPCSFEVQDERTGEDDVEEQ